ncbi:hypothetical protein H8B15_03050 [Hymenobacter sp. BT507]|uniref:Bifunctional alpha,alpha-trehalose-phosphate synthase (UDP-forming)/trehalose-phosphatase n=1 Tax=Hymenobacter citatus TaxID=2763506 RepID=A0ABR7MH40_9BACT|nr:hypothetical protein [Hymenobacter citatus]MBC6609883.1 hypothetical protein [Hymenobacter citatus]
MSRTIIISNRLPTKIQRTATGLTFQPSEGGLATGLGSIYRAEGNVWVGWPGLSVDEPAEQDHVREQLRADSMALGDDRTDEDTFAALPPEAYTLKVGPTPRSLTRYAVANVATVRQLLGSLLQPEAVDMQTAVKV